MARKKITITIGYEEDGSLLKHTLKHTVETEKDLHEVIDAVRQLDSQMTGQHPML